ncbi:hypothetical protein SEA_FINKLE_56 [Gordonia phage Finkle]|uniref:Uncharacterized protein n=1 Tax=Gordonia phage Finkle TaxID=2926099 RepID=A0A9E7NK75_9CAUD|nr:hypothetical protein QEH33_gp56 [Gordonia phage Finkle]UTN92970.1 hypothetical protein SEA_FINKLE_56 [Gordonia phage Finkle]
MNTTSYGGAVHSVDGPTVTVQSHFDPWDETRTVTVQLVRNAHTPDGPARLGLEQTDKLIELLRAARNHVAANAVDDDAAAPGLTPRFVAALPPKRPQRRYGRFADALIAAPGMWAKYPRVMASPESAATTAARISSGRARSFPGNRFEAEARGRAVYVRYRTDGASS